MLRDLVAGIGLFFASLFGLHQAPAEPATEMPPSFLPLPATTVEATSTVEIKLPAPVPSPQPGGGQDKTPRPERARDPLATFAVNSGGPIAASSGGWVSHEALALVLSGVKQALHDETVRIVSNSVGGTLDRLNRLTLADLTDANIPDTITAANYLPLTGGSLAGELDVTALRIGTAATSAPLAVEGNVLAPELVATISDGGGSAPYINGSAAMFLAGDYLYIGNYTGQSLEILDVSDPHAPTHVGALTTGLGSIRDIYVAGDYAYIAGFSHLNLYVVDVSNPSNPQKIGVGTGCFANPNSVVVSGQYAYVVGVSASLCIFDVGNPRAPTLKGSVNTGLSNVRGVTVAGNYAYVYASGSNALAVADIANPAAPTIVATITDGLIGGASSEGRSIAAVGNRLYYWSSTHRALNIYSLANPASPTLLSSLVIDDISASAGLFVGGSYAYVAGSNRLAIVDVAQAGTPRMAAMLEVNAYKVAAAGNYAYVISAYGSTASIVDVAGARIANLQADSVKVGNLSVTEGATFSDGVSVANGLSVSGSTLVASLAASATSSFAGRVGIGTTSPWRTLSVSGTVGLDGLTGATGAGSLCLSASKEVVFNSGSDACLSSVRATKHDIATLDVDALATVLALQPVSFVYNEGDGRTRYGFIAEDTAAVLSPLATYSASTTVSGIDDRAILSVVVAAIQTLWTAITGRLEDHDQRITELEAEVAALRSGRSGPTGSQQADELDDQPSIQPLGDSEGGDLASSTPSVHVELPLPMEEKLRDTEPETVTSTP